MPPYKDMVNYGKSVKKQKFERTVIPEDLEQWPKAQMEDFIAAEWHKRRNGVWIIIKEKPVYLTGPAYVFFNYWTMEGGTFPEFRFEAVEYFWIADMAELDRNCYGIFDIKCRRLGDTEKAVFLGWEMCTRYRSSHFGMQNKQDADAKANFQRAVIGAQAMPFFFQPVLFAGDTPQNEMIWRFPQQAGNKRIDRRLELKGSMGFRATKDRAYDGRKLRFYHLDEPGKISPKVMNCITTWEIVRLCLSLYNGKKIIGKAHLTSTVEFIGDGESVEIMQQFWDESNPAELNENGRTISGLWRVFRGYTLAAEVDEYGFHKASEAKELRDKEISALMRKKKYDQVTSLKRRQPATIHEALVPPETDCILGAHMLDEQISRIEARLDAGEQWPTRCFRGDFVWSNGFGSDVIWRPNDYGRFEVSGHPQITNHRLMHNGLWAPQNAGTYGAGADPIDHVQTNKVHSKINPSDGALAIGCLFDELREQVAIQRDEYGNIENAEELITNRCVCTYSNRPANPYDYYEDVLKAIIYYGCKINIETQKPGIISWLIQKGYQAYLAKKPATLDPKVLLTGKQRQDEYGSSASTGTIGGYVDSIINHNMSFIETHTHLTLLRDMRKFNGRPENRTQRDITVAWGWCRVLLDSINFVATKTAQRKSWQSFPLRTYQQN